MGLPALDLVEKRMSKNGILRFGVVSTPEIAQCPLGDLNF
jgi:hypothetical protein